MNYCALLGTPSKLFSGRSSSNILKSCLLIGMLKMKKEPLESSEVTEISPCSYCSIILEMVRPKPMPPWLILVEWLILPKKRNSLPMSSCLMPIPVSITSVINTSFTDVICIFIDPWKVNFRALPNKLKIICL